MRACRQEGHWLLCAIVGLIAFIVPATAWPEDILVWNTNEPRNWHAIENWNLDGTAARRAPSIELGDGATLDNHGIAYVNQAVEPISSLAILAGEVEISGGGSLAVGGDDELSATTHIGNLGVLSVTGDGTFRSGELESHGRLRLLDPAASVSTRGNFTSWGTMELVYSSLDWPGVTAQGVVTLGGEIHPRFQQTRPAAGDVFTLIADAEAVIDSGAELVLPDDIHLPRGIGAWLQTTDTSAEIAFGSVPLLSVDRRSGTAHVANVGNELLEITGYSIVSEAGLLNTQTWTSLSGSVGGAWQAANPTNYAIAEVNPIGVVAIPPGSEPIPLGSPYAGGAVLPDQEDLKFLVSLADGSVVVGQVEYEGAPNNLTLLVDPDTGQAELSHQSEFVDAFDVTGYRISSPTGLLLQESWTSLSESVSDAWIVANPVATSLAEINPTEALRFTSGTEIALGAIFDVTSGIRDLQFEFSTVDGQHVLVGSVQYVPLTDEVDGLLDCSGDDRVTIRDLNCANETGTTHELLERLGLLQGDLDGSGTVDFEDFLIFSLNFGQALGQYTAGDIDSDGSVSFPDFLILSRNFGQAAVAVPEGRSPGWGLLVAGACGLFCHRPRFRHTIHETQQD